MRSDAVRHTRNRQARRIRARRHFRQANAADDEEGMDEAAEYLARLKRARELRRSAVQEYGREPTEVEGDPGRNEECPCSQTSGVKYKHCCLKGEARAR